MLLLSCPKTLGWRSFKIDFTRFDFEANSKLVDVKVHSINTTGSGLSLVLNTIEIIDDVDLSASIALETNTGNYTNLLSKTFNFCKMIRERNSEPLMRSIYQDMMRYGKWFTECPVKKGTYTLQNYRVDEELLPSFLPETNFKSSFRFSGPKNEQILKGILYGRVDKSKGFNNLKMFSMG
ncbi:uncharacterized protein LOC6556667 [Drosophila grimshawi]|uniref:GH14810 n=1 Tax=Drosophila grimshawi TaxID=7222 RepID=B4J396_DROGR|nr:uncharacterized protein LOC6556667 [Drosophila grimshawi]EDV97195.1 GH14810 [Drosophila grimshawi]